MCSQRAGAVQFTQFTLTHLHNLHNLHITHTNQYCVNQQRTINAIYLCGTYLLQQPLGFHLGGLGVLETHLELLQLLGQRLGLLPPSHEHLRALLRLLLARQRQVALPGLKLLYAIAYGCGHCRV